MISKDRDLSKLPSNLTAIILAMCIGVMISNGAAHAGTGGSEFDTVWTQLSDWTQGTLGRIISILTIVVGLGGAVVRQNLSPVIVGGGSGLVMYNAPNVIESILAAAISGQAAMPPSEAVIKLLQAAGTAA